MCHKTPPQIGGTGTMSPGIPKDPWGSISSTAVVNPFMQAKSQAAYNQMIQNPFDALHTKGTQVVAPSKTTHITVTPVSNGFVIRVSKNSTTIERIVPDFENIGDEIMTALAEIQLGK